MNIETLKEDARIAIFRILNKSLKVEYKFMFNYPRMIDQLITYEKINDEQLNRDLEFMVKESLRHFKELSNLIERLDGEVEWMFDVIDRLVDVEQMLTQQLENEKLVKSLFEEAKHIAELNKVKVKVRERFDKFIKMKNELPVEILDVNDIISVLNREIIEEEKHIKLVENSIATLNMLMHG